MPVKRFALAWMLGSYSYSLITAYAGSVSTIDDPAPAIFTAIGMMLLLWMGGNDLFQASRSRGKKTLCAKILIDSQVVIVTIDVPGIVSTVSRGSVHKAGAR